jgi:hypothetical protein
MVRIPRIKITNMVLDELNIVVKPERYVNIDGINVMININEVDDVHLITKEAYREKYGNMSFSIYHAFKDDIRKRLIEVIIEASNFDEDHILFDYKDCIINDTKSIKEKREEWKNSMSYAVGFDCEPCPLDIDDEEEIWLI